MISKTLSNTNPSWWRKPLLISILASMIILFSGIIAGTALVSVIGWSDELALDKKNDVTQYFVRWDAGYYLDIARQGYLEDGKERAFFPLYPIAVSITKALSTLPIQYSGSLVAFVCFVCSCLGLYKLSALDYSASKSLWTVAFFCCFPLSFFYIAPYAESLFFLTSIASLYFLRRGNPILSGVMIALAGATRPTAFVLAIPYVVEFIQQRKFDKANILKFITGALIAPTGILLYLLYLANQAGAHDVFSTYFAIHDSGFNRVITWPWNTVYDGIMAAFFQKNINGDWFSKVEVWHDLLYAAFGITASLWSISRIRLSYSLYMLGSVLLSFSFHGPYGYAFWSIPRHIAVLFPVYIILTMITASWPKYLRWITLILLIGYQSFLTAWFVSGRWVA